MCILKSDDRRKMKELREEIGIKKEFLIKKWRRLQVQTCEGAARPTIRATVNEGQEQ